MTDRESTPTFGYLYVVTLAKDAEVPAASDLWVGGYLVVTSSGRPLEFHCTAPVIASRAQQILYGKSLRPFVFGEYLGAALIAKARFRPNVLLIADADAAAAGRGAKDKSLPTVLLPADRGPVPAQAPRLEAPEADAWLLSGSDPNAIAEQLQLLAKAVDLAEPFERIREAINEAQQGVSSPEQGAANRDAA